MTDRQAIEISLDILSCVKDISRKFHSGTNFVPASMLHSSAATLALKKEGMAQMVRTIYKDISALCVAGLAFAENFMSSR
jgi:hypothetical protein